jgi:hypothetical protein
MGHLSFWFAGFSAAEVANVSEVGGDEGDAAKGGDDACKRDMQSDFTPIRSGSIFWESLFLIVRRVLVILNQREGGRKKCFGRGVMLGLSISWHSQAIASVGGSQGFDLERDL